MGNFHSLPVLAAASRTHASRITILNILIAALLATQQLELPPPPRGYGTSAAEVVVDAAGVLDQATISRLNRIAFEVKTTTGGEMAIVTMPDLRGRDVADVALRIGRDWGVGASAGVGDRTRNAAVVVLVVPKETSSDGRGHVRIEVGRGVEGFVPDGVAGDIQRAAIPLFERQDYGGAILQIVSALSARYAAEFGVTLDTSLVPRFREEQGRPQAITIPPGVIIFLMFVAFLILSGIGRAARGGRGGRNGCLNLLWLMSVAQSNSRHRGGWGGGGFGGGSFGGGGGFGGFGGGGGFSGGGSSGSW